MPEPLLAAVLGFALVAGLVTVTPGLDTVLVVRTAIGQGWRDASATALGIIGGVFAWAAAAAVGLSALLAASEVGFLALRVVGAGYLVWLGVGMLRQAFGAERAATAEPEVRAGSWWANARRGLLTNLLNPKVGAFYLALLPQFLPAGESPLLIGLLLGAVHAAESVVWFAVMIGSAHLARAWFESRRTRRAIDGASGAAMIGFGVYLAARG